MNAPELDREAPAGPRGEAAAEVVLVGAEEAAAGVGDDEDLVGTQQLLADESERIASSVAIATRVADDVGVAGPQAERVLDVEPRVHAGEDREAGDGAAVRAERSKTCGVALVLRQDARRTRASGSPSGAIGSDRRSRTIKLPDSSRHTGR